MSPQDPEGPSIAELYLAYQRQLLAHLTRLVHDRAAAEDLLQETFEKALRRWETRDPRASASAWLYRIATNSAYDYLRRLRRIQFSPLTEGLDVAEAPEGSQIAEREPVLRALAQIPPIYRLPLVMHSYEGRSTTEIAGTLGCSTGAVKTRLFRARERFRAAYQA